jgi:hypothetical protein
MLPQEGQIRTGPLFSEPVRVETVRADGPGDAFGIKSAFDPYLDLSRVDPLTRPPRREWVHR